MRTIEIILYEFKELPEEIQTKAIENLSDINVNYDWWQSIYEDAEEIGLNIISHDLYKIDGSFKLSAKDVVDLVLKKHGTECSTYQIAERYKNNNYSGDLKESLKNEYLQILKREYNYLVSDEAIVETIESMNYEFTENGEFV